MDIIKKQEKISKDLLADLTKTITTCHIIINEQEKDNLVYFWNPLTDEITSKLFLIFKLQLKQLKQTEGCVLPLPFIYNPLIPSGITEERKFNIYQYPLWRRELKTNPQEPLKEIPPIYFDFLMHLVKEKQDSYSYILDWISNTLSGDYTPYLLAVSGKGSGKGLLGSILSKLHGDDNTCTSGQRIISSTFNSQTLNKTLICLHEIKVNSEKEENNLKLLLEDVREIEGKGVNSYSVKSYSKTYITSNSLDIIKITKDERRFSIPYITNQNIVFNTVLMDKYNGIKNFIIELLSDENIRALGIWLLNHKIERNMVLPFYSNKKQEILEATMKDWEIALLEKIIPRYRDEILTESFGAPTMKKARDKKIKIYESKGVHTKEYAAFYKPILEEYLKENTHFQFYLDDINVILKKENLVSKIGRKKLKDFADKFDYMECKQESKPPKDRYLNIAFKQKQL